MKSEYDEIKLSIDRLETHDILQIIILASAGILALLII